MKPPVKTIAIVSVTVLAAAALVIGYFMFPKVLGGNTANDLYSGNGDEVKAEITFDSDTITYNGKGDFDPLVGVKAKGENGEDLTSLVSYSISEGEGSAVKTINYGLNAKEYSFATASRTLQLENYKLPSIKIAVDSLQADTSTIDDLLSSFPGGNQVYAQDGYGNDITDQITCNDLNKITSAGSYVITLSVENFLGDKATAQVALQVTGEHRETSSVVLTTDSTVVTQGAFFDPTVFVETVTDKDGNDIFEKLNYVSDVNVNVPGTYKVSYYINGEDDVKATLDVLVS